ncbi:MAG TPA: hypothetical protein VIJ41_00365 [Candidatus Nanopelagicales bacterium]
MSDGDMDEDIDIDVDDGPAFAAACAPLVASLGGGFMISSQAKAFSEAHGFRGRQGYTLGRGSVLGDVDADVVTSAFGFWPADKVREWWDSARELLDVRTARDGYAETCRAWGRARFAAFEDAERLADLLSWVVDGTDVAALPLYAGWRAVPLTDDAAGRLAQQLHVLREYRGGMHLVAVVASGLSPLQAVLSGPGGSGNASFFGWEEPFEDATGLALARSEAEALTDRLVAPSWDVLGHDERVELLTLLARAARAAFGPTAA